MITKNKNLNEAGPQVKINPRLKGEINKILNELDDEKFTRLQIINKIIDIDYVLVRVSKVKDVNINIEFNPSLVLPNTPKPYYDFKHVHLKNWDPACDDGDLEELNEKGFNYSVEVSDPEDTELNTKAMHILYKTLKNYLRTLI